MPIFETSSGSYKYTNHEFPLRGEWTNPLEFPQLENDCVHLWLQRSDTLALNTEQHLSGTEKKQAAAISSNNAHHRFIATRVNLRVLLAAYTDTNPRDLQFRYGPKGKPHLVTQEENSLHFNVSHSGDFVLFAITRLGDIGVDIERVNKRRKLCQMRRRFFTSTENDMLQNMSSAARRDTTYDLWCRKEALGKAIGGGVLDVISKCDMLNVDLKPPTHPSEAFEVKQLKQYYIYSVETMPGYASAMAISHSIHHITCHKFM